MKPARTNEGSAPRNRAFTIYELKTAGLGRTKAYEEIAAGRLIARKIGHKTIVLESDLAAYLENLPRIQPNSLDSILANVAH
ncbi:hypothetical protein [Rhodoblastus sp.]|uniref:helix-turn-helix domain-containing protein n=1 Tax=Rhodoblastus sp. TaxID=1962975 RepID=UPI00261CE37C|nr:hypothetical protein [Rhodoblastus sp.]